jgi:hypothetical protein
MAQFFVAAQEKNNELAISCSRGILVTYQTQRIELNDSYLVVRCDTSSRMYFIEFQKFKKTATVFLNIQFLIRYISKYRAGMENDSYLAVRRETIDGFTPDRHLVTYQTQRIELNDSKMTHIWSIVVNVLHESKMTHIWQSGVKPLMVSRLTGIW